MCYKAKVTGYDVTGDDSDEQIEATIKYEVESFSGSHWEPPWEEIIVTEIICSDPEWVKKFESFAESGKGWDMLSEIACEQDDEYWRSVEN